MLSWLPLEEEDEEDEEDEEEEEDEEDEGDEEDEVEEAEEAEADDDDDDDDRPVRTNCLPHSVQKVALSKPFVPQLVQKTGTTKAELGWSTTSLL